MEYCQDFLSVPQEEVQWDRAKVSDALTPEQVEILEKRGVLEPSEIHRLASKTRAAVGADEGGKAGCHSDVAEPGEAQAVQAERVAEAG